jgi:hypothetical protein
VAGTAGSEGVGSAVGTDVEVGSAVGVALDVALEVGWSSVTVGVPGDGLQATSRMAVMAITGVAVRIRGIP